MRLSQPRNLFVTRRLLNRSIVFACDDPHLGPQLFVRLPHLGEGRTASEAGNAGPVFCQRLTR